MEFKVGDRVRIKKNDIVGCVREATILERSCSLNLIYYELEFVYAVISENRVYVNLKEEDLELIEKFKEPTPIEELEKRIEKLEKSVFKELVDKETPMKVIEKLDNVPVSYERFRKCPKCEDLVTRMYLYCPYCGQKLDWSEE